MKYLIFLLSVLLLMACDSQDKLDVETNVELTEEEIYDIVNEGYYSYLDSIGRKAKIHYQPILIVDTSECNWIISDLNNHPKELKYHSPDIQPPKPTNNFDYSYNWNQDKLSKFVVISENQIDSVRSDYRKDFISRNIYCISRPYQSKESDNRVVIMENMCLEFYVSCFPIEPIYLVFKKQDGKWKFEKRY